MLRRIAAIILSRLGNVQRKYGPYKYIFVPPEQVSLIRSGQSVQLQVGSIGPHLQLAVTDMFPQVLSPAQVREQYALDSTLGPTSSQTRRHPVRRRWSITSTPTVRAGRARGTARSALLTCPSVTQAVRSYLATLLEHLQMLLGSSLATSHER